MRHDNRRRHDTRRRDTGQDYHFDHGLLHYIVVFAVGIGISWLIEQTYADLGLDGWLGLLAEDMVVIYIVLAVVGLISQQLFKRRGLHW